MKVVVDYELCEANAICMRVLPEVFRVDDQDKLHLLTEEPPEALRERLKEAVRRCPRQALSIQD